MRGKVLGFDDRTGEGMISGDDGQRYPFTRTDLKGGTSLVLAGQEVDFESQNNSAASIFLVRGSFAATVGSDRNKYVAALLAFFLGLFGAHKFYLGHIGIGVGYLVAGTLGWILVFPPLILSIICIVEAIIFLTKPDEEFYRQYVIDKRPMF